LIELLGQVAADLADKAVSISGSDEVRQLLRDLAAPEERHSVGPEP
jgi:hypothetical protein